MSERLILEGSLQRKKMLSMQLATRAAGLITAIKIIIQPAAIRPLKDLKTGEALSLIRELDDVRTQYLQVQAEIDEIRQELQ